MVLCGAIRYIGLYNIMRYIVSALNETFAMAKPPVSPIDTTAMRHAAEQAVTVLSALSNSDRLLLLCQLSQGELSVGELEQALDIRQPTLSQQLGVLRSQELVATRRDGKRIFYSVSDAKLLGLLQALYQLYCPAP